MIATKVVAVAAIEKKLGALDQRIQTVDSLETREADIRLKIGGAASEEAAIQEDPKADRGARLLDHRISQELATGDLARAQREITDAKAEAIKVAIDASQLINAFSDAILAARKLRAEEALTSLLDDRSLRMVRGLIGIRDCRIVKEAEQVTAGHISWHRPGLHDAHPDELKFAETQNDRAMRSLRGRFDALLALAEGYALEVYAAPEWIEAPEPAPARPGANLRAAKHATAAGNVLA